MSAITKEEFDEVMDRHAKWLRGIEGGAQAGFYSKDLTKIPLEMYDLNGVSFTCCQLGTVKVEGQEEAYPSPTRRYTFFSCTVGGIEFKEAGIVMLTLGHCLIENVRAVASDVRITITDTQLDWLQGVYASVYLRSSKSKIGTLGLMSCVVDANLAYSIFDPLLTDCEIRLLHYTYCSCKTLGSIEQFEYLVTFSADVMTIGCHTHRIEEWWEFTDDQIHVMDFGSSLRFWRRNKDLIKAYVTSRQHRLISTAHQMPDLDRNLASLNEDVSDYLERKQDRLNKNEELNDEKPTN